jgi:nuclear pore complex protein Nup155
MEYLKVALATDAEYERRVAIKQSLNSFKEAADQISLQNLKTICDIYIQFAFHVGIIELALERAKKQDPQNLALLTHESPQYADESKVALSQARMDSYNFALHALNDVLLIRSQQLPPNRTPISDPKVYARNVIDAALKYDDQLFHYTLYNWLMEKNMQEELSTIDTPYLIPYFQKHVADEKSSLEFLWVHYRNKEEYFEAAKCLRQLAHTESPTLTLSDRLKYLSYAATNAQSAMAEGNKSQYLPRLYALIQEDIRVCKLQERVQSILRSQRDNAEVQWAADNLDRGLFSRVELWKEYGSRFLVLQHVFETTAE